MSNFSRKNHFKEIGRTCLFDSAEGWESSFVLLQIFYFGRGLRSISLLGKDITIIFSKFILLPPKNCLEWLSFLFIFLHVKSVRSLFLEVAISLAYSLVEESFGFRRLMRRRNITRTSEGRCRIVFR